MVLQLDPVNCVLLTHYRTLPHLCENVVRLTEDPSGISVRGHQKFQRADVDVSAQRPEVRLLQVVHTLQLLHLHTEPQEPTANDYTGTRKTSSEMEAGSCSDPTGI